MNVNSPAHTSEMYTGKKKNRESRAILKIINKKENMPNQNFVTGKKTIKNENKIKAFRHTEA